MDKIDAQLRDLAAAQDTAIEVPYREEGFFSEVLSSFRGDGSELRIFTWVGILTFGALLIYCIIQMLQADNIGSQITYAAFAIMLNSAQIALKLWFNMRLNRRAVIAELRKLRLDLALSE